MLMPALPQPSLSVATLPVPTHDEASGYLFDGCPNAKLELPGASPDLSQGVPLERSVRATVSVQLHGASVGATLAFGAAGARLLQTADGPYVEVLLAWPQVRAWGYGQSEFLEERARARCIEQYAQAALELVHEMLGRAPDASPLLTFTGPWEEHGAPLRRRVSARFVQRYLGLDEPRH